jgi:photosystem II stability/assembly factor-like uncharacterized protein
MRKLLFIVSVIILFASCRKETMDALVRPLSSNTDSRINDIYFTDAMNGFAVGGIQWESGFILRTSDGGESWQKLDTFDIQTLYGIHFYNSQVGQAVGVGGKVLRTDNGGQNWEVFQENGWEMLQSVYLIDAQNHIVVGGDGTNNGIILRSFDNTWWKVDKDTFNVSWRSVWMNTPNTGYAVGYGAVFKTIDAGFSWQATDVRGDYFKKIHFPLADVGYICGFQGSVLKTDDGGQTWQQIHRSSGAFFRGTKLNSLHFYDENTGMVCGLRGVLFFTENGGNDWKKIDLQSSENLRAVFMVSSQKAIVAGDNGKMWEVIL